VTVDRVRQAIYYPSNEDKMLLLVGLLREIGAARVMIFVNMKREAERVQDYLQANGLHAAAISGDVPQKKRMRMLTQFQEGEVPILIGTDVASRGLHIPDVEYVINYDLPHEAEDYVHRIGRTARAGASGNALSLGCETYAVGLPAIEDYIGHKIPFANYDPDNLPDLVRPKPRKRKPQGGRGGPNRNSRTGGGNTRHRSSRR
jgi:ATP-dependent RNA helicase RhlB